MEEKIILGIDPGSLVVGFGVVRVSKQYVKKAIAYNIIRFKKHKEPMVRICTLP